MNAVIGGYYAFFERVYIANASTAPCIVSVPCHVQCDCWVQDLGIRVCIHCVARRVRFCRNGGAPTSRVLASAMYNYAQLV